ncbi:hypothetical protein LCGC14_2162390, partial [marine sediment metagenome]
MGYAIDGVQVEASAAELNALVGLTNPSGAEDYFVDLNVSTS